MGRREKGFWLKRKERYTTTREARSRAQGLRLEKAVSHVQVLYTESDFVVSYSVAKWYLEELKRCGLSL